MDFDTINDYTQFITEVRKENKDLKSKYSKLLNKFCKKISKMKQDELTFMHDIHKQYILKTLADVNEHRPNPLGIFITTSVIENIGFGIENEDDDFNDDEDNKNDTKNSNKVSVDAPPFFGPVKKPGWSVEGYNWVENDLFKMHITKDGLIWLSSSLWQLLIDILYEEAFSQVPLLFKRPPQPNQLVLNMAYKDDKIALAFAKGCTSSYKLIFNAKEDADGKIYGELDPSCMLHFQVETYFNLHGDYIFDNRPEFGIVTGYKVTSSYYDNVRN